MAYREFDPTAMKIYQKQAVAMFNDQITAASTLAASKAVSIAAKKVSKAAAEVVAKTAMMPVLKMVGTITTTVMEPDQAARSAAETLAQQLQDEIDALQSEIDALKGAVNSLSSAITETNDFVEKMISAVGNSDAEFAKNFNTLIEQINDYKSRMKTLVNSVDDTLMSHGYYSSVNIKQQFSETMDDFTDSAMINNFRYIPSSYIYQVDDLKMAGRLNERILNAVFKKDSITDLQTKELMKVLDNISVNTDLKSLEKFVNSAYTQKGELNGTYYRILKPTFNSLVDQFFNETMGSVKSELFDANARIGKFSNGLNAKIQYASVLKQICANLFYFENDGVFPAKMGSQEPWITLNKEQIYGFDSIKISPKYNGGFVNILNPSTDISELINRVAVKMGMEQADILATIAPFGFGYIFDKATNAAPMIGNIKTAAELAQALAENNEEKNEVYRKNVLDKMADLYGNIIGGGTLSINQKGEVTVVNSYAQVNGPRSIRDMVTWYNGSNPSNKISEEEIWNNMLAAPFTTSDERESYDKYESIRADYTKYVNSLDDSVAYE